MRTVLWLSTALLGYTLVIYPGLMVILGWLWPRQLHKAPIEPTVSLIVAACNEEHYIVGMMRQLQKVDYPKAKLEAVVASDAGSTDRTHEIVSAHETEGWRLIQPAPGLIGKNESLDEAVRRTSGEILVFADATARWEPSALRELVANFADERVGCVSVRKAYWLQDGFGPQTYRKYMKFEALIDQGSSVFGYIPNASGAFHALRRELYETVANHVVRDLIDPAQAAAAGKLSVFDRSVCYADAPWVGAGQVYRARLRITRRALSATGYVLVRLWRGLGPLAVWQFVSHKLLRWLLWLPALGVLISSAILAQQSWAFVILFWLQAALYTSVWPVLALADRGIRVPGWLTHVAFFVLSLVAMAYGWWSWLRGERQSTWRLSAKP